MDKEKQRFKGGGVGFLPDDITLEILSRLPVNSLLRHMCVSRHWKSLISHNSFRTLHRQKALNYNPNPAPLMLVLHSSTLITVDLLGEVVQQWSLPEIFSSPSYLELIPFPSQSKLVCFVDTERFYLCNPTTRRLFPSIPKLQGSRSAFGFGYVQSKDEYIIVHVFSQNWHVLRDQYIRNWDIGILSLSIDSNNDDLHCKNAWKSIDATTINHIRYFTSCNTGVFVCGVFYWLAIDDKYNRCIVSFNSETQVLSTVGLAVDLEDYYMIDYTSLMEIKGELYFMSVTKWPYNLLQLWKVDVKNELWTQSHVVNLHDFDYENLDGEILIYRLQYLEDYYLEDYYNHSSKFMRKLRLEDRPISSDVRGIGIHTNLFTL